MLAKKRLASLLVLLQRRREHGVARRHVGERGRRHLAQVAQRLLEQAGQRLAVVDPGRAALVQVALEGRVAAHRVVPRQPVEHDRREGIRLAHPRHAHHGDIGAHHLLRVDDGLRHAGAARGEQEFADRLRLDGVDGLRHCIGRLGRDQLGPRQRLHLRRRLVDVDQQHAFEIERGQGAGVDLAVLHEDQAGPDEVEDVFQLGMVLAHHRIGRRHRRNRRARLHGGHGEQRELDGVRGQDHHRPCRDRSRGRAAPASPNQPAAWPRHR